MIDRVLCRYGLSLPVDHLYRPGAWHPGSVNTMFVRRRLLEGCVDLADPSSHSRRSQAIGCRTEQPWSRKRP
jgi:hypothetical protein